VIRRACLFKDELSITHYPVNRHAAGFFLPLAFFAFRVRSVFSSSAPRRAAQSDFQFLFDLRRAPFLGMIGLVCVVH